MIICNVLKLSSLVGRERCSPCTAPPLPPNPPEKTEPRYTGPDGRSATGVPPNCRSLASSRCPVGRRARIVRSSRRSSVLRVCAVWCGLNPFFSIRFPETFSRASLFVRVNPKHVPVSSSRASIDFRRIINNISCRAIGGGFDFEFFLFCIFLYLRTLFGSSPPPPPLSFNRPPHHKCAKVRGENMKTSRRREFGRPVLLLLALISVGDVQGTYIIILLYCNDIGTSYLLPFSQASMIFD